MDKAQLLTLARRAALAIVLGAALLLRVAGATTDYPWYWYPDRDVCTHARDCINPSHPRLDPGEYIYPTAYIYLNAIVYGAVGVAAVGTGAVHGMKGLAQLYYGKFGFLVAVTRILGSLLALVMIWMLSRVVRRVAGAFAGLLAAIALAFAWLDVVCCHFPTTDVPSAFMLLATAIFALRLYERSATSRDYLLGGLLAGVSMATKYPAVAGIFSLAVAHWFAVKREREEAPAEALAKRPGLWGGWALIAGATALSFLLICPWAVLNWTRFFADMLYQRVYNACGPGHPWQFAHFLFGIKPAGGMGLPLVLASLVGFGWLIVKKRREAAILLSGPVIVWLAFVATTRFFNRWYETLMPFLAMGAGIGVAWGVGRIARKRRWLAITIGAVAMLAMIAKPIAYEAWYDWILTQPGSRRVATRYMASKVPPGSTVVLAQYAWAGPNVPTPKYHVEWMLPGSPERMYTGLKLRHMLDGGFGRTVKSLSPRSYEKLAARARELLKPGDNLQALLPHLPAKAGWAVVNLDHLGYALEGAAGAFTPVPGRSFPSFRPLLERAERQMLRDLHSRQISEVEVAGGRLENLPWGTWPYGSPRLMIYQLRPATKAGSSSPPPKSRLRPRRE